MSDGLHDTDRIVYGDPREPDYSISFNEDRIRKLETFLKKVRNADWEKCGLNKTATEDLRKRIDDAINDAQ